jgi:hypothetical protein
MTKREIMPKLKDIALGIIGPAADPDHADCIRSRIKRHSKELNERQKKKTKHPDCLINLNKVVKH